jgi:hypothetical protein
MNSVDARPAIRFATKRRPQGCSGHMRAAVMADALKQAD